MLEKQTSLSAADSGPALAEAFFRELLALLGAPPEETPDPSPKAFRLGTTRTIGYNYTAASQQSWKADADYVIVSVLGAGATNAAIMNFTGATYASMSVAGVHLDWIAYAGANTVQALRQPLFKGELLYCSSAAGVSGATLVTLEYA